MEKLVQISFSPLFSRINNCIKTAVQSLGGFGFVVASSPKGFICAMGTVQSVTDLIARSGMFGETPSHGNQNPTLDMGDGSTGQGQQAGGPGIVAGASVLRKKFKGSNPSIERASSKGTSRGPVTHLDMGDGSTGQGQQAGGPGIVAGASVLRKKFKGSNPSIERASSKGTSRGPVTHLDMGDGSTGQGEQSGGPTLTVKPRPT